MSDNINIEQKTALGSHDNTFIAEQHNYTGLSVVDATKMAFAMFREYYPQLRQELLDMLYQMIMDNLKNVPAENIVAPKARIAVPVLQNASITEEQEIRDMYANLLASSMNKVVQDGIHPGFVDIIRQLAPDEAKILQYMSTHKTIPTITLRYVYENNSGIAVIKNFSDIGEKCGCEKSLSINTYFNNLERLGVIKDVDNWRSLTDKNLYEPLKQHAYIIQNSNESLVKGRGYSKTKIEESFVELTDYGIAFCKVCISK